MFIEIYEIINNICGCTKNIIRGVWIRIGNGLLNFSFLSNTSGIWTIYINIRNRLPRLMAKKSSINVHPLTSNPTEAWRTLSQTQKTIKVNVKIPSQPVDASKVRFVCMSDTHSLIRNLSFSVPDGDVFIHAGDFTKCGKKEEVLHFNYWLKSLPHKYKVVICGNHELSFDNNFAKKFKEKSKPVISEDEKLATYGNTKDDISDSLSTINIRQYLTDCIYLEDSGCELFGLKIYGTPWQPEFGNWAFNLPRGERCLDKWDLIPDNTDVLITHSPPLGHGDLVCSGVRAGCVELLSTVQQRVKPKYHIFGHIHEGYGVSTDGKIIYINASTCDINYIPRNLPIVFDVPLPEGYKK